MDTVKARTLRPYEGRKLKRMKHQLTNSVNRLHARIILLSRGGNKNARIAAWCDCSPAWVRKIIHRFNARGVDGICWYPYFCGPTGPKTFVAEVVEQICEIALSPPKQLIGMAVWSLAKLRDYLVAQKVVTSISLEHLRQILRHRKIKWRHTKTWKDSKDPRFWPKYRRIKRLYAKRPKGGRRISIDEFGPLNLMPRHTAGIMLEPGMWIGCGPPIIDTAACGTCLEPMIWNGIRWSEHLHRRKTGRRI